MVPYREAQDPYRAGSPRNHAPQQRLEDAEGAEDGGAGLRHLERVEGAVLSRHQAGVPHVFLDREPGQVAPLMSKDPEIRALMALLC